MNTKQLKYVLTLAAEGSFVRAAETLGITQPSLSQYIKKTEADAHAVLFDRSGADVRLTDAGRVYIDIARQILALEHRMSTELEDIAEGTAGTLTVGTSPYRSAGLMPEVLKRFRALRPGISVTVEEMTTAELLENAERCRFDICLTMLPVDARVFTFEKIMEEELLLAVPADRPAFNAASLPDRKYPAVEAAALNRQEFIMITESQRMQRALDKLCLDYGLTLRKAAVVKSLNAEIAMVASGVGLALVPSGIERLCPPGSVRFYSLVQDLPRREIAAIWPKERPLTKAGTDLLRVIREVCS